MWSFEPTVEAPDRVVLDARRDGRPLGRAAFFDALGREEALRTALTEVLAGSRFEAFAWETAPLHDGTADRPFAMAIVDSPGLRRVQPEPEPFLPQLGRARVRTFANLGGDAVLVVPHPDAAPGAAHLARFVRASGRAPPPSGKEQAAPDIAAELWTAVAAAVAAWPANRPLWVSTAGLGVHWLHVRLDARPKYYRHRPFTSVDA